MNRQAPAQRAVPLLQDYLEESAERLPDKVALVCEGRRVTYAWLDAEANRLAHALATRGVRRGDRVLLLAENTVESVVTFWAALKANAVACPVSPLVKAPKLAGLLADCTPAALVASVLHAPLLAAAAGSLALPSTVILTGSRPDVPPPAGTTPWTDAVTGKNETTPPPRLNIDIDLASLIYTSGSTGEPKGIMLTHRNILTASGSITTYLETSEDDVILTALPLSFDYGLYQVIMAFRMGATVVLERSFAYPAQVLSHLVEERATGFPGVPTMFATLAGMRGIGGYDFSGVRYVTNTAAAIAPKHVEFIRRTFSSARFYSMYGLTECKRCSYLPPADLERKPGSVGIAIPNTEFWVVDEEGRRLGPNQVGQLVVRGATVMKGYWNKPEPTARRLRPGPLPGEQVLYTGDLCRLDDEGYLYFVSRMDEIIKTRGEKVAPREVEAALLDIPGVAEAAVVGIPDTILGQAVRAFVVPTAGTEITPSAVRLQCQARLEPHMVPAEILIVPALPQTGSMKVNKRELL